jgi:hypothetical protein
MERRHFIKLVSATAGFAAGFGAHVGEDTIADVIAARGERLISDRLVACPGRRPTYRDRSDMVYHLFLRVEVGEARFFPAADWTGGAPMVKLPSGQMTYGHEASVCNYIAEFLNQDLGIKNELANGPTEGPGPVSKIVIGSGASNKQAEMYLGTPRDPNFEAGSCKLHFGILKGKGTLVRKQYGTMIERDAHVICDCHRRPLYHPDSRGDQQTDDYLLVTRIPGEAPGTYVTIFAGLHGPGTRAAELLYSDGIVPLRELESLHDKIGFRLGRTPFFQAIFRASEFDPELKFDDTQSDVATKLELVEAAPLTRRL